MSQNSKLSNYKKQRYFNICVIGAGYVGLVAAACFAKLGNRVICVDNDKKKIEQLKKVKVPNFEPGLEKLVKEAVRKKKLSFIHSIAKGVKDSQIIFIAVGTPPKESGEADLTALEHVARKIAEHLDSYKLIVEKSTVPVQTGLRLKESIRRYAKRCREFDIASNPEFLREGRAIDDFLKPDRVVIGVESDKAEKILQALYKPLGAPVLVTDINTAELIKHASNSFLATKISFINAISLICERAKADVSKVAEGVGMDKRIGREFLKAGIGYGGSCFPKDVLAFIQIAKKVGVDFKLLEEAKNINLYQRRHFVEKIKEELWILKNKTIAVLGVSFKPDTDDIRQAPALDIIKMLKKENANVKVYDPEAASKAKKVLGGVSFCNNVYDALYKADCLALCTEWSQFSNLDFRKIKKLMRYPFVADGRNFFDREKLQRLGFRYLGIGR